MSHFTFHLLFAALAMHWNPQASHTDASLRGLSVVSSKVAWASGSNGTVLRTVDGGEHWEVRSIAGAATLDFRDVVAFDGSTALAMSSGTGDASRVYLTADGGGNWKLILRDPDESGFFDAMKFWDRQHGILLGDPVEGHFAILTTVDGGRNWVKADNASAPLALKDEGAFAASGTCLALYGRRDAWFGTGGRGGGRVFRSRDGGQTWAVTSTPLSGQTAAAGIFSLKFTDRQHGIALGGDYKLPEKTSGTIAMTADAGRTWLVPPKVFMSFRSGVTYLRRKRIFIAVGSTGSDVSFDGGSTWSALSKDRLNAIGNRGDDVWAVGSNGLVLKLITGR